MLKKIGRFYRNTALGYFLLHPFFLVYELVLGIIPDELYIKLMFKRYMGYSLNLENPITLNEKIKKLNG